MRFYAFTTLALTLTACAAALTTEGAVTVERDEFTGRTDVKLEGMRVSTARPSQLLVVHVTAEPGSGLAAFTIVRNGDGWRYLRCHSLAFVADTKPLDVHETRHDGTVEYGSNVREVITAPVPLDTIRAMAIGHDVRGRICDDQFTFDLEARQQLAEFYNRVLGLVDDSRESEEHSPDASSVPSLDEPATDGQGAAPMVETPGTESPSAE